MSNEENKPKILVLDIETKPGLAYIWSLWDDRVPLDRLIDSGGILCVGAKWLGSRETIFFSEWEHGYETMIRETHNLLSECDGVISYNGDKFDLPKLMGHFLSCGLTPPPPPTSIDIYKSVKKLGLISNKLAYVGEYLSVGNKVKHEGFSLWIKVMEGNLAAQRKMQRYCLQDVRLTERVYKKIRPYILNHPFMGLKGKGGECGACHSTNVQSRGYRRTKFYKIQRLQCMDCGSWSTGKRTKIG